MLTSRERVLLALDHKEPDRVPLDYSADQEVTNALCEKLGLPDASALLRHFHVDIRRVGMPFVSHRTAVADPLVPDGFTSLRGGFEVELPDGTLQNVFGTRRTAKGNRMHAGYPYYHPLAHVRTVADVEAHPWPNPDDVDYDSVPALCEEASAGGEYATLGGPQCRIFHDAVDMVGMERFFILMAEEPEVAAAIIQHVSDYYYEVAKRFYAAARGKLDIAFSMSDLGTQRDLMISPAMWRRMVKPHFERLYRLAHEHGMRTFFHSDGAIRRIIPDLIEIGLDCLNPIQAGAVGMEPGSLKEEFGQRLAFHGSIDVQKTLPFGSTEDVQREVIDRLRTLGRGGGFILSCSHSLLADVPLDNIITMYETAYEYGFYPHLGQLHSAM